MLTGSESALISAVLAEIDRAKESLIHGRINVSYSTSLLANGIKYCNVQVECKWGCGYLIEAFDEEADKLKDKAIAIQNTLKKGISEIYPSLLLMSCNDSMSICSSDLR